MDQADVQAIIDRLGGVEALLEGREEFHPGHHEQHRYTHPSWACPDDDDAVGCGPCASTQRLREWLHGGLPGSAYLKEEDEATHYEDADRVEGRRLPFSVCARDLLPARWTGVARLLPSWLGIRRCWSLLREQCPVGKLPGGRPGDDDDDARRIARCPGPEGPEAGVPPTRCNRPTTRM